MHFRHFSREFFEKLPWQRHVVMIGFIITLGERV